MTEVPRQVDPARSYLMSRVRGKDTAPEMVIRRGLHSLGYRYRLHAPLPGKPDLVFPSKKKVIFIHGCFWHRHPECSKASTPKTRSEFWNKKFADNVARDERNIKTLRAQKWKVLVIWECETKRSSAAIAKAKRFLDQI